MESGLKDGGTLLCLAARHVERQALAEPVVTGQGAMVLK